MKTVDKLMVAGIAAVVVIVITVEQNRQYHFPPVPISPPPVPNAFDTYVEFASKGDVVAGVNP